MPGQIACACGRALPAVDLQSSRIGRRWPAQVRPVAPRVVDQLPVREFGVRDGNHRAVLRPDAGRAEADLLDRAALVAELADSRRRARACPHKGSGRRSGFPASDGRQDRARDRRRQARRSHPYSGIPMSVAPIKMSPTAAAMPTIRATSRIRLASRLCGLMRGEEMIHSAAPAQSQIGKPSAGEIAQGIEQVLHHR